MPPSNPSDGWPWDRVVRTDKVRDYLLKENHPVAASKAKLFLAHGFTPSGEGLLMMALLSHAKDERSRVHDELGADATKMVCEGPLKLLDGSEGTIRSVWQRDVGDATIRLATAIPLVGARPVPRGLAAGPSGARSTDDGGDGGGA